MANRLCVAMLGLGVCVFLTGCGSSPTGTNGNEPSAAAPEHDHSTEHDHTALGPHGGHLIVLGEEAFHAELTHDENSHTVTVYLLDAAATETVTNGPDQVTMQVFRDGEFADYVLKATGDEGTFAVTDEALCDFLLHAEKLQGRLRAEIDGQEYVGLIEHSEHASLEAGHDSEEAGHDDHES